MSTIINTPGQPDTGNSATIWVIGLIIIVLIGLFAFFVWPKFGTQTTTTPTTNNTYNTTDNTQPPVVNNYTNITASSTTNNSTTTLP